MAVFIADFENTGVASKSRFHAPEGPIFYLSARLWIMSKTLVLAEKRFFIFQQTPASLNGSGFKVPFSPENPNAPFRGEAAEIVLFPCRTEGL
jgi:hypothetical protein